MNFEREIELLIKSRYPLVSVRTIEEEYVIESLYRFCQKENLSFFRWSVTAGLRANMNENSFYHSNDPLAMLKLAGDLIGGEPPAVFALSDFHKFLDNKVNLRLFKEHLIRIKNTENTFVVLGSSVKLPEEIKLYGAELEAGYPTEEEIMREVYLIESEFRKSDVDIKIAIDEKMKNKLIVLLKGLSFQQIRRIVTQCVIDDRTFDASDFQKIAKYKKEVFDSQGTLEYFAGESPKNIAGFSNLKTWINKRKRAFYSSDERLPAPKGVLLCGVQGAGKSLAAKVIASEFELPLYRLDLNRLYSKYIGETEENLRNALKTVGRLAPVCLWMDEIEKALASSSGDMDGGVSQRVLGTFLTWMQERKEKAFIIATANDIKSLPPELLRKGRFDEIFFVDLPDLRERKEIFKIHLSKRGFDFSKFNVDLLSEISDGFSGAEIEQAIISAMYDALNTGAQLDMKMLFDEIRRTRPLSVVRAGDVSFIRNWAKERSIVPV